METTPSLHRLNNSQALPLATADPRPAMLLWVCGKTLILVFLIIVIATILPLEPRSVEWGTQLTSQILNAAFLPLIGVALLRVGSLLQPWPDPNADPAVAMRLARRRHSALQFSRRGVVSLSLLALWHVPLFLGSVTLIDQRNAAETEALSKNLQRDALSIQRASAAEIQGRWQELSLDEQGVHAFDTPPDTNNPEDQRMALISQIESRQQEIGRHASSRGNAARFALLHNALRSLVLCLVYVAGFLALGRRRFD
ncbi:MAG: hypothetical protein VKJ44_04995 [Synechococcus sp.]|nr:hypothetical protein [Synechococcus sp.]